MSVVPFDTTGPRRIIESFKAFRIFFAGGAIFFVGSKRGKRKQGNRKVVSAFMWQKISVMLTPEFWQERKPKAGIFLKFVYLLRVEFILQITGDHEFPFRQNQAASQDRDELTYGP